MYLRWLVLIDMINVLFLKILRCMDNLFKKFLHDVLYLFCVWENIFKTQL